MKQTFRFFRKTDDLDIAIQSFFGSILAMPLSQHEIILTPEDVEDIIQSLPGMNLIKTIGFFNRIPLPFRISRCVMSIHNVYHVPHNYLTLLRLSQEEKSNTRLLELLRFLLFFGSDTNEVSTLLEQHRSQVAEMHSSFRSNSSQGQRSTTASPHSPPPPDVSMQHAQQ